MLGNIFWGSQTLSGSGSMTECYSVHLHLEILDNHPSGEDLDWWPRLATSHLGMPLGASPLGASLGAQSPVEPPVNMNKIRNSNIFWTWAIFEYSNMRSKIWTNMLPYPHLSYGGALAVLSLCFLFLHQFSKAKLRSWRLIVIGLAYFAVTWPNLNGFCFNMAHFVGNFPYSNIFDIRIWNWMNMEYSNMQKMVIHWGLYIRGRRTV